MTRYRYIPLREDKDSQEIRILEILPGDGEDDSLRCTLTHHALPRKHDETRPKTKAQTDGKPKDAKPLDYEAVSWTWGLSTKFESIEIRHESDWATLAVRPNLLRALIQLRNPKAPRKLWIDAVCIDQENKHEKDLQVAMMADIYSTASNVCIWLGGHEDDSEKALKFINEQVSKIGTYEDILENPEYASHWKALAALMIRPWFSRRWVVQEIALARHATLQCEDMIVKWSLFETAVALFQRDAARIAKLYRGSQQSQWDSDLFGDVAAMGASRLVDAKSNLFRRADDGSIIEYRFNLSELVANLSSFDANLAHDMIYAILSLARDTHAKTTAHSEDVEAKKSKVVEGSHQEGDTTAQIGNPSSQVHEPPSSIMDDKIKRTVANRFKQIIKPQNARIFQVNYEQEFFEVCKQFLNFTIPKTEGNNLDILCRPWAPQLPKGKAPLPSWIPSVVNAPFGRRAAEHGPGGYQTTRKNFDPLVGLRTAGTPYYNASWNQRAKDDDWVFGDTDTTKRSLFVTGFELDRISEAESHTTNGDIPVEWFNLVPWDPWQQGVDASDPPERFWRTLIADRGPEGTNAPVYYTSAFTYAVEHSTPENGIETTELSKRHNPILVEFLKRMKAVVWNRKLFKSSRDHHLGLAPKKAKDGDRICILRGCSVPVILREKSGGSFYEFIGECYLHTMMDGRAIDVQQDFELPTERFELR